MDINRAVLILKMMSNPIRLRILKVLAEKKDEICVGSIEEVLGISQSSVSQHLAHLRNSGILVCEKRGKKVCYKILDQDVYKILENMDLEID